MKHIFLVDAGNSRIKWARWAGDTLGDKGYCNSAIAELNQAMDERWNRLGAPEKVIVSSVLGEETKHRICCWCIGNWACEPEFPQSLAQGFGVRSGYDTPSQLGVDRWLAMIGAWEQVRGPACVVDCGTAVTIDALGLEGRHLGGLILPGLGLMRRALFDHTHALDGGGPVSRCALARNTEDGIMAGSLTAVVATIERVVDELKEDRGKVVPCVVTGGEAPRIVPHLSVATRYDADLVFRGMLRMTR